MHEQELRARLEQVRGRWLRAEGALALAKAFAAASLVVAAAWLTSHVLALSGGPLVGVAALTLGGIGLLAAWAVWPLRTALPPERLARYIEEHFPELEDRVVSAVAVLERPGTSPFESLVVRDAVHRLGALDLASVIDPVLMRRRVIACGASAVLLLAVLVGARSVFVTAARTAWYAAFPPTLSLSVTPGNARLRAGESLAVSAELQGSAADLAGHEARVLVGHGDAQRVIEVAGNHGRFTWEFENVDQSLEYQVRIANLESDWFHVEALHPARVARIDLEFKYPSFSGLAPRSEEDTGDIYAPQGTDVTLSVATDKPVTTATLALADGQRVVLTPGNNGELRGQLKVATDSAYRVALVDTDGLENPGDTEYFIRVMDDRPPEVKVSRPGGDRQVTRLEEVAIEVRADDDYGIDRLELVYTVSGQTEKVVPLHRGKAATTVTGRDVLFVEDLDVKPGDFVTYYARARDVGRGKSPSIAQSDIFFLDVRPFSEEFVAAQSQAGGGGSMNGGQLEELITAQKDIIVATWKVERRAAAGRSAADVKAIQKAQGDVRKKTATAIGDAQGPRRRPSLPGQPPPPDQLTDPLQRAVESMGKAEAALGVIKTGEAIPHEMDALNRLLEAQAENTRRQVTQQQNGGGSGREGQNQDLSALFDRELLRQTETNYETEKSARPSEEGKEGEDDALSKLRELARRQDDLAREQRELAKRQEDLAREELKRQLERLTREQAELRQEAERLAEQMAREAQAAASQQGQQGEPSEQQEASNEQQAGQRQSGQSEQQSAGQQSQGQRAGQQAGQRGQEQSAGQPSGQQAGRRPSSGSQASQGPQGQSDQLRQASEQMRNATGDLRRSELEQAAERSQQAVDQLRELERQLQSRQPGEQRRQLGELQLEARQLAESQRRLASEAGRPGDSAGANGEARRRAAGEQRRLAERAEQLEQALENADAPDAAGKQSLGDAARELEQRRVAERMRRLAEAMGSPSSGNPQTSGRAGQQAGDSTSRGREGGQGDQRSGSERGQRQEPEPRAEQQELAATLDRVADRVSNALGRDAESRELSEKLAELRGLRERLGELERRMDDAARASSGEPKNAGEQGGKESANGQESSSSNSGSRSGARNGSASDSAGRELGELQAEYARELQRTESLLDQLRQENPSMEGRLASLEQHYYSRSAPGTEAFKQDFARWEVLRRDVQQALERVEGSLANRLAERDARQRLNVGGDDPLPESYRKQISDYYRSLRKRPGGSS